MKKLLMLAVLGGLVAPATFTVKAFAADEPAKKEEQTQKKEKKARKAKKTEEGQKQESSKTETKK